MTSQPATHDNDAQVLVLHAPALTELHDTDYIGAHQLTIEAGITYRQLDYWTRCGWLTPATDPEPGSGYIRVYPRDQIALATEMRRVLTAGITTPLALVHATALQILNHGCADLGDYTLTPRQETP